VNSADPVKLGLAKYVNLSPDQILNIRNEKIKFREDIIKRTVHQYKKKGESILAPSKGFINNIVIFIRFKGEDEYTDSTSMWDGLFNTNEACMKNYYLEDSYNQLTINTHLFPHSDTMVISYQDSLTRDYYKKYDATTNPNGYTNDNGYLREITLLGRAVDYVRTQVPPDLNIDEDNDGFIDNICFMVSGNNEAWADLLWPHMNFFDNSQYKTDINGKNVGTYNFQLRSWFTAGEFPNVLCHEMGHSVGYPDLYRYNTPGNPIGGWDMMSGNTGHNGAWMKYKYTKWIDSIPVITQPGYYSMNDITKPNNNAFMIKSDVEPEFFVVEYRKKQGLYESGIPNSGMLVYRINLRANGNAGGPPDEIYIYRPNGTLTTDGNIDLAPLTLDNGRTAMNDFTNPPDFLSFNQLAGLDISDVSSCLDQITFAYKITHQSTKKITLLAPADKSINLPSNIIFSWNKLNQYEVYNFQVAEDSAFVNKIFDMERYSDTTKYIFGLDKNKTFYWRVREQNMKGYGGWSDVWSFTTGIEPPVIPIDSMIAYYPLNGDALDYSGNGHDATMYNNITPAKDRFGYNGNCMYFNGNGSYFEVGAWNIGANFSVSGWVKFENFKNWSRFMDFGNGAGQSNILIANAGTTNDITYQIYTSTGLDYIYTANVLPLNDWVYITATYSNGDMKLYLNANLVAEATGQTPIDTITRTNQYFGKSNWGDEYFNGWMDDIRIYAKELSQDEIIRLFEEEPVIAGIPEVPVPHTPENYTDNVPVNEGFTWKEAYRAKYYRLQVSEDVYFTKIIYDKNNITSDSFNIIGLQRQKEYFWRVSASNEIGASDWSDVIEFNTIRSYVPYNDSMVAYYPFNANANDESGSGHHGIVYGASLDKDRFNNPNSAYYFDGYNDYIDIGDWTIDTTYTITGWFKYQQFNNWSRIFDFGNGSPSDNLILANQGTSNNLAYFVYKNNDVREIDCNGAFQSDAWTHFAAISDNGSIKIYLNGTLAGVGTDTWIPNLVLRTNQYLGRSNWGSDQYFQGWLDDIRIYNVALNQDQISGLYYESGNSVQTLTQPVLIYPINNEPHSLKYPVFKWDDNSNAASYQAQVSLTSDFSTISAERISMTEKIGKIPLEPYKTYFWRVRGVNLDGKTSDWSEVWSFTTFNQLPSKSYLISPAQNITVQLQRPVLNLNFSWTKSYDNDEADVVKYSLNLYNDNGENVTVNNIADTIVAANIMQQLKPATTYYFYITATDGYDKVSSDTSYFRTADVVLSVKDPQSAMSNVLEQNYPNPFESNTTISFTISERSDVNLSVYDIYGNMVSNLVNNLLEQGKYTYNFNLGKLPNGVYYYKLRTDNYSDTRQMVIIR
jgi:M6 family metalloprotease-like protein